MSNLMSNLMPNYIYKNKEILFNSITKKTLPILASKEDLEKNYFLNGQRNLSLDKFLFKSPEIINIKFIPTWGCNLRCSHCSVLHILNNESQDEIDVNGVKTFVKNIISKYSIKFLTFNFVGGEALLKVQKCIEIYNEVKEIVKSHSIDFASNITTNLAMNLNQEIIEFLQNLNGLIFISLDGNKNQHNTQRHGYKNKFDCFQKTYDNIKILVKNNMREKLHIKAALKDEFRNIENAKEFYKSLLTIGILFDNIEIGAIHPTYLNRNPQKSFFSIKKNPVLKHKPCCKFRFMSNFQINPNNKVYDNFYLQDNSYLGTLYDDIELMEENHKKIIKEHMPIFKDEKCMECPVIGFCWGDCINSFHYTGNKPSDFCDQKALIKKVNELASSGDLL